MKADDIAPPSPERVAEFRAQCSTDAGAALVLVYFDLMTVRIQHAEAELRQALALAPRVTRAPAPTPAPCADCKEASDAAFAAAFVGGYAETTCRAHRRVTLTVLATDAPQIMRFLESVAAQ